MTLYSEEEKPDILEVVDPAPEDQSLETTRIQALEAEVSQLKDQWIRSVAEADNIRKRAEKDREEAIRYAAAQFGRDMIQVADNLRRAMESCPAVEDVPEIVKSLIQGLEMTESGLLSAFERHGLKTINPLNEKFDAHYHQAMFEVEDHTVAPGTITQVLQIGYILHERLLRPAMVGVAKQPSSSTE